MLPLSLIFYDFMPNIVLRDIQARRGVLCLVDETFHKVLLVLPVVGYHVIKINLVKQLDRCLEVAGEVRW